MCSSDLVEQLAAGTRVYGYLPPSTELLVTPARTDGHRFIDVSAHRAALPAAYNGYLATDADPVYDAEHEDEQMILRPLFFTSFLIDDFLADSDFFASATVILSSASSKTSTALAFLLSRREGIEVLGLTSARSAEFARGLGVYDARPSSSHPIACSSAPPTGAAPDSSSAQPTHGAPTSSGPPAGCR